MSFEELATLIEARIGRWAVEFQAESGKEGTLL
jgi:hypothetical protein